MIPRTHELRASGRTVTYGCGAAVALCVTLAGLAGCGSSNGSGGGGQAPPNLEWAQWPMPDSGTILCTDGATETACPSSGSGYGQDGNYLVNLPSYSTSSNTVLDTVTGLRWQRVMSGSKYTWSAAPTYCAGLNLDGYTGWRVPTYIELVSLADLGRSYPAIDVSSFPGDQTEWFWSSSSSASDSSKAWGIHPSNAELGTWSKDELYRVRCVR